MPSLSPQHLARAAAPYVDLGSFGVRFLLDAAETGGAWSVVEHPVPPRTLAAPQHRPSRASTETQWPGRVA